MKRNTAVGPDVRATVAPGHWFRAAWCLLFLVAGFAVATQLFASNLAYHPSLGPNVQHMYPPWDICGGRGNGMDVIPTCLLFPSQPVWQPLRLVFCWQS
jgi:hypothetical protein